LKNINKNCTTRVKKNFQLKVDNIEKQKTPLLKTLSTLNDTLEQCNTNKDNNDNNVVLSEKIKSQLSNIPEFHEIQPIIYQSINIDSLKHYIQQIGLINNNVGNSYNERNNLSLPIQGHLQSMSADQILSHDNSTVITNINPSSQRPYSASMHPMPSQTSDLKLKEAFESILETHIKDTNDDIKQGKSSFSPTNKNNDNGKHNSTGYKNKNNNEENENLNKTTQNNDDDDDDDDKPLMADSNEPPPKQKPNFTSSNVRQDVWEDSDEDQHSDNSE